MAAANKKRRLEVDEDAEPPSQERGCAAEEETHGDSDKTRIASNVESRTDSITTVVSGLSYTQGPMDDKVRHLAWSLSAKHHSSICGRHVQWMICS